MRYDVIIIGAGAAGLMAAAVAGGRGRRVLLVDHGVKIAQKIRISGGGRCNFTNIHCTPANFISDNSRFAASALSRYTPADFIALVDRHGIAWHEKTLGQLFCDGSSQQIIDMLVGLCNQAGVTIRTECPIRNIARTDDGFGMDSPLGRLECASLVIATGGLSIPKMGATGFGYQVAEQFGLPIIRPAPALVPFTFNGELLEDALSLAGVAVPGARVHYNKTKFDEAVLFTHRGMSGPAILQISSYWRADNPVRIQFLPQIDMLAALKQAKMDNPKQEAATFLATLLPKRLVVKICDDVRGRAMGGLSNADLHHLAARINDWRPAPSGTEGHAKAEVTRGGVDTRALSSQTMEAKTVPGLYFIGEVVDVTGHLGGFNFQWAWASGHAAGMAA